MTTFLKFTGTLVAVALALFWSSGASAIQVGTLPASGSPNFTNAVDIKWTKADNQKGTLQVESKKVGGNFEVGGQNYPVDYLSFTLRGLFNNDGSFSDGQLRLNGVIPDFGATGRLLVADLVEFDWSSDIIGFTTNITFCADEIAYLCTTNETVYLYDFGGGFDIDLKTFRAEGMAITTIPVPAAVWLFGSGLIGLAGLARRKKAA